MADITDLGDPIGSDDEEPEPCDWYAASEPLDLGAIDEACCTYANSDDDKAKQKALSYVMSVAQRLVAETRAGRERIAEWEALEKREEWTVTDSAARPPMSTDRSVWGGTAEMVADYAAKHGAQMWRRMVSEHPAELIDLDAPF